MSPHFDALISAPMGKRILGPIPTLKELNVLCWGLFLVGLVLTLYVIWQSQMQSGQPLVEALNVDFVYFYGAGRILNEYPAEKLYDYEIREAHLDGNPHTENRYIRPFPYPPFVAILFRPFAVHLARQRTCSGIHHPDPAYRGIAVISSRGFFPATLDEAGVIDSATIAASGMPGFSTRLIIRVFPTSSAVDFGALVPVASEKPIS
jgi:hypothetical protein